MFHRLIADRAPAPIQKAADYTWSALTHLGERHAFPPVPDGRLPGRSACQRVRWTAAAAYAGGTWCQGCITALRDDLRAVSVALAAAGIRTDLYQRGDDAPFGAGEDVEASRG